MSDLTRRGVLRALQEELPEPVKECEKSVLEDNPDMDRSNAIAICRDELDMGEREELADQYDLPRVLESDPCWEGYVMVGTKTENGETVPNCVPEDSADAANLSECPDGQVSIGDDCVPVEQVDDTPPSALEHSHPTQYTAPLLLNGGDVGAIERIEQDDGSVRYSNIKLLAPGKWTDQASEETIHYSANGIQNMDITEDARVNIMHDVTEAGEPNPPSDIGHIDPESAQTDAEGNLYADIVLEMDSPGSEYADENLQTALESGGEVGVSGPSVEIPAEGQRLEWDREAGLYELKEGKISGAGIVWNPASKDVDFTRETAQREIAMALGGNSDKALYLQGEHMSDKSDRERIRQALFERQLEGDDIEDHADMIADMADVPVSDVLDMLEPLMEGEEMGDYEDDEEEDEDTEMADDEEEEEEEDEDMEMADEAIDVLEEQIDDIWGKIDELEEMMATQSEMSDTREELADAEEVKTLRETVETLDKELGEARTMADGSSADTSEDWKEWAEADGTVDADPNSL